VSRSKRLNGVADAHDVWGPTSVKKRKPGFRMPSTASVFPMCACRTRHLPSIPNRVGY